MALDAAGRSAATVDGGLLRAPTAAFVVAVATLAFVIHVAVPFTGDVSWLLTASERWLAGQTLYVDIFELNPPISVWLYAPAVKLAQLVGVPAEVTLSAILVLFALLTIGLSGRTLAEARLVSAPTWWIAGVLVFALSPIETFAQREHFAVLAALPLLAACASRAVGRSPSPVEIVVAGALGGFAVAIKPHFALAFALPALALAIRARSIRPLFAPELLGAATLLAIYLTSVWTFYGRYFSEMAPIAKAIYLPNQRSNWELLVTKHCQLLGLIVAATILMRFRVLKSPLTLVLGMALVGFLLVYWIQARGWPYHLMPALLIAMLIFALAVPSAIRDGGWFARLVAVGLACFLGYLSAYDFIRWRSFNEPLRAALAPLGSGKSMMLLSGDLSFASPLHRLLGNRLVNRGPSLWQADNAFALMRDTPNPGADLLRRVAEAEEREHVMFREDLRTKRPDIILAQRNIIDWLAWARKDPETAKLLDGYREVGPARRDTDTLSVLVRGDGG